MTQKEHNDRILAAELAHRVTPLTPQRCTTGVRRQFLLDPPLTEPAYYNGVPYRLVWRSLGVGVHELRLERYKENT